MKIKKKMTIAFIIIMVIINLVGAIGIFANQRVVDSFGNFEDYKIKVDAATEASSFAKRAEGHAFLYLTLGDSLDKEKFFERHNSLEEQITLLKYSNLTSETAEQLNQLELFSDEILEYGTQLIEAYDEKPIEFDFQETSELVLNFHDASSGARKAGVAIVTSETADLTRNIENAENFASFLQSAITMAILFLSSTALVVGTFVSSSIFKPIKKLREFAIEIGSGKLGQQTDLKLKNEIGDLADSINKMSQDLKNNQAELLEAERHSALEAATWVGHDLRNPLQAIKNAGFVINKEMLKLPESSPVRKNVKVLLEKIDDSVKYSDRVINNLKDFGSKEEPEKYKTDINGLIQKIMSGFSLPSNIDFVLELGQIPPVKLDSDMMERVFINLISNSLDAMEKGGKLLISTKKTKEAVEVNIQDSGKGMPPEVKEKIFDPFFTTKAKGMGVGLSICKNYVEKNGGTISVTSTPNEGSTFTIKLPLKQ